MSTLHLPQHSDDLHFLGRIISHLEHADDILLMSTSLNAQQFYLDNLLTWCNILMVNKIKTMVMIFNGIQFY
jgi:hypothetical protein